MLRTRFTLAVAGVVAAATLALIAAVAFMVVRNDLQGQVSPRRWPPGRPRSSIR